jgi:hypothetical protein
MELGRYVGKGYRPTDSQPSLNLSVGRESRRREEMEEGRTLAIHCDGEVY